MPWRIVLKLKGKTNDYISKHMHLMLFLVLKDDIEMEYGLFERANILWKALEKIFDSSNDKISSSKNILENVSSSSIHIDQDQEEQSSVEKEKVKSVSLGKLDSPVYQIRVSSFGRTETSLVEEEDCSTSSFDDDDDDDDTNYKYDFEELLLELKKLISKHMKLQNDMWISYVLIKNLLTHMHC
jgi:hypothetical protein